MKITISGKLGLGLIGFHFPLTLNSSMLEQKFPRNFIKISHNLTHIFCVKSTRSIKSIVCSIWGRVIRGPVLFILTYIIIILEVWELEEALTPFYPFWAPWYRKQLLLNFIQTSHILANIFGTKSAKYTEAIIFRICGSCESMVRFQPLNHEKYFESTYEVLCRYLHLFLSSVL